MPNTIQKGSEKCEHSFELMNVAGLPEEVIFICPKCGTPQEGKITIKKPMTQINTTQNKDELTTSPSFYREREQWENDFDKYYSDLYYTKQCNSYMSGNTFCNYKYSKVYGLKNFISKLLSQAHQSGIEEERKRIRKK